MISFKGGCSSDPLQLITVLVVPHDHFGWNTPSFTSIYRIRTRVEATSSPLFDFATPPNSFRSCWHPYELNDRCQEVRILSETSKFEVDLEIKVGKGNFNESVVVPMGFEKQSFSITGIFQKSGLGHKNGEIEMVHQLLDEMLQRL